MDGIARHRTTRKTPQQNGLVKRINITILERVRYMLFTSSLSKSFWAEVATTTMNLINMRHSSAINFKTLRKMWQRKPSNSDHLRVFGCTTYAHVKDERLDDPKALGCIFLGYLEGIKGYKL